MIFHAAAFYLFATIAVASAVMVIASRNPVHSVLFLICAFFNSAGLFLLMGAEFLALILVVVYVGAVAVLFLFVVMMLEVDFAELRRGFVRYMPVGGLIGMVLLAELVLVASSWLAAPRPLGAPGGGAAGPAKSNIAALGEVLYTDYIYLFQAAGLILLVAMIGAIVLTLRAREGVKRQKAAVQIGRKREEAVAMVKVEPGQGI